MRVPVTIKAPDLETEVEITLADFFNAGSTDTDYTANEDFVREVINQTIFSVNEAWRRHVIANIRDQLLRIEKEPHNFSPDSTEAFPALGNDKPNPDRLPESISCTDYGWRKAEQ